MKSILIIVIISATLTASSQGWSTWLPSDTTWHTGLAEKEVNNPDSAEFWSVDYTNPGDTLERFVEQRYKNGSLRGEKWQHEFETASTTSRVTIYYPTSAKNDTGQINHSYYSVGGWFKDTLRSWWPDGTLKRLEIHGDKELISGSSFNTDGIEELYTPYLEMPVFPGEIKGLLTFLGKKISFPKKLRRKGISGKVLVKFDVLEDGRVENWEIVESPHELFSDEVIRVLKIMPAWKPGKLEGEKVTIQYNLPVSFTLR